MSRHYRFTQYSNNAIKYNFLKLEITLQLMSTLVSLFFYVSYI